MSRSISEPCAECAKKHLYAALAYAVASPSERWFPGVSERGVTITTVEGLVSRAFVLAAETHAYPDHLALAIGTLVRAEEEAMALGCDKTASEIRDLRLSLADGDMVDLRESPYCSPWYGHVLEAKREWPQLELPESLTPDGFVDDFGKYIGQVCPAEGKEVIEDGEDDEEGRG